MTEAEILRAILIALGARPECRIFRNSVGQAHDPASGQHVRFGLCPGASDLLAIVAPYGRWLALEVKSQTGQLRPDQKRFLAMIRGWGGIAEVVRSVDDALAALRRAQQAPARAA